MAITNMCINICLSEHCETKFKAQLTASIFKHLIVFQKFSMYSQEPFGTCLQTMVSLIMQALQCHDKKETLIGAIKLSECVLAILDEQRFEQIFAPMTGALRGAADMQIGNFEADIQTIQGSQETVDASNPLARRLMNQLEVLQQWTRMFKAVIERFESKNYCHFAVIIRSEDLARVFVELLALTANQGNARYQHSLISFSGKQNLDQILNQTKTNVLESYNMLLEYALQMSENI